MPCFLTYLLKLLADVPISSAKFRRIWVKYLLKFSAIDPILVNKDLSGKILLFVSFSSYCFFNACQVFLLLFLYFSVSLENYSSINFNVTLYSQVIRNDIFDFFSHASHISLGSSFKASIRSLFFQDLSFNSVNFGDTLSTFKRSWSMALSFVFKSFFLSLASTSSSSIFLG